MAAKTFEFDETENPDQLHFYESRAAVAGFTGGFGNGKTAVLCLAAITIASQYENARVLVGRATRPKLEDSTKKELLKWVPKEWVARWPTEKHNDILFKLTNSTIEFRHVRQEGKGKGEEQSNLLSATYDAILIDQMDDPEFSYKDFADLIGRMRGQARYIGDDKTMPRLGPQFFRFTANPTRNWLFREVVGPYFTYRKHNIVTSKLLRDDKNKPIVQVFNAPSEANKKHTGEGYVQRMRAVFRGSMASRYIGGDWSAYEGLVYPDYREDLHMVTHETLTKWIEDQLADDKLGVLEAYDYGQVSPSCYLLAFFNDVGDIFIVDGFYIPLVTIDKQAKMIKEIRNKWQIVPKDGILADPAIFKGTSASKTNVGESVANIFLQEGIQMVRGANSIQSGIDKVSSYLAPDNMHRHPIIGNYGAARLFVSSELEFWHNEIADYYWNKNIKGDNVDKPRDTNDHAMDATKYLLSRRGFVVGSVRNRPFKLPAAAFQWIEVEERGPQLLPRHM